jgi:hypothetical protein
VNPIRAALVVATLVVVSLTAYAPATAGGPTSALLSVPGEGKTASLYYTDPEYDALAGLVGIEGASGAGESDRSGGGHESGPGVTVTWLIHDVTPWRVDRIYPDGEGGAWVASQVAGESGSIWDSPVSWHRPESGRELMRLLDRLGVGRAASAAGDFDGVAGAPVSPASAAEAAADPVTTASATPTDDPAVAGIWWALGGLVVGVLAALAGLRLRRRETSSPDAPTAPATTDTGTVVAEELSWPAPRT